MLTQSIAAIQYNQCLPCWFVYFHEILLWLCQHQPLCKEGYQGQPQKPWHITRDVTNLAIAAIVQAHLLLTPLIGLAKKISVRNPTLICCWRYFCKRLQSCAVWCFPWEPEYPRTRHPYFPIWWVGTSLFLYLHARANPRIIPTGLLPSPCGLWSINVGWILSHNFG